MYLTTTFNATGKSPTKSISWTILGNALNTTPSLIHEHLMNAQIALALAGTLLA